MRACTSSALTHMLSVSVMTHGSGVLTRHTCCADTPSGAGQGSLGNDRYVEGARPVSQKPPISHQARNNVAACLFYRFTVERPIKEEGWSSVDEGVNI